ncbi:MAG: hypothetical protein QF408_14960, partial [Pirellulales bacterium]|nr:hypothetical protein [Pirellulales bacterium]
MQSIKTLLLFVHAIPGTAEKIQIYMDRWKHFLEGRAGEPHTAVCILSTQSTYMSDLIDLAKDSFGERCFVDPIDENESTMTLIGNDLALTLSGRGSRDQWIPYEIWTSNNARMWTEGLKKDFEERGYNYDGN